MLDITTGSPPHHATISLDQPSVKSLLVASTLPVITATRKPSWVLLPCASKQSWIIVDSSHYHDLLREGCFMKSKENIWNLCFGIPAKNNSTAFLPASCGCFMPACSCGCFMPACSTHIMKLKRTAPRGPNPEVPGLRSRTSLFWGGWMFSSPIYLYFLNWTFDQGWTPHGIEPSWLS